MSLSRETCSLSWSFNNFSKLEYQIMRIFRVLISLTAMDLSHNIVPNNCHLRKSFWQQNRLSMEYTKNVLFVLFVISATPFSFKILMCYIHHYVMCNFIFIFGSI